MGIERSCRTCDLNFRGGICAGHDCAYKYGEKIADDTLTGESWCINDEYLEELRKSAPWYLKEKANPYTMALEEFLIDMDKYYNNEPIRLNIYDVIEKVYGVNIVGLSEILGVPATVIGYAKRRGTIARRATLFARKLFIPISYFEEVTQLDIKEIEKCKLKYDEYISNLK